AAFGGPQIQSDASVLPFRAGSAAVIALINMFLFPTEISRVLADDGVVLWVSTNGDQTPIYLPPADVLRALPGPWAGITAEAGWGTWLPAGRAPSARATNPSHAFDWRHRTADLCRGGAHRTRAPNDSRRSHACSHISAHLRAG